MGFLFDAISDAVLKFARSVVDGIAGQILQQTGILEDVAGQFRSMLQPVMNGAWTGDGAEAFISEVQSRLIPEIMALIASIGGFSASLNFSTDIIDQTDDKALNVVDQLGDVFDRIF